jgi:hypothetical protein
MNTNDPSRRRFLHQAAGLAVGVTSLADRLGAAESPPLLPTVKLGPHAVTRGG